MILWHSKIHSSIWKTLTLKFLWRRVRWNDGDPEGFKGDSRSPWPSGRATGEASLTPRENVITDLTASTTNICWRKGLSERPSGSVEGLSYKELISWKFHLGKKTKGSFRPPWFQWQATFHNHCEVPFRFDLGKPKKTLVSRGKKSPTKKKEKSLEISFDGAKSTRFQDVGVFIGLPWLVYEWPLPSSPVIKFANAHPKIKHLELKANYSTNTPLVHPLLETLMDIAILNFWIWVIASCLQSANIILLPSNDLVLHVSVWEIVNRKWPKTCCLKAVFFLYAHIIVTFFFFAILFYAICFESSAPRDRRS